MSKIEDLKNRLIQAREEFPEAQIEARREKANAKAENRKPNKTVMDRPAKLESELDELPDSVYAAEIEAAQSLKATAEKRIADNKPLKAAASDRMKAAREAKEAAEREYNEAYQDYAGKDRAVTNGERQKGEAERRLEALYQRGPAPVDKASA